MTFIADDHDFLSRIYEAAFVPDLWPSVLDELCRVSGGIGAGLFTADPNGMRWVATDFMNELLADFAALGQPEIDVRTLIGGRLDYPGFMREQDFLGDIDFGELPLYRDFLWPRGAGFCVGTPIRVPSGDHLVYSIEGRREDGPFSEAVVSRLDALRPHLARAAILSGRFAVEQAQVATETLSLIGLPAAVLSSSNRAMAVNALFEPLIPGIVEDRQTRLTFRDGGADALLEIALSSPNASTVRSIALRPGPEEAPMIAHLVPVCRDARHLFSFASWIMIVTRATSAKIPSADLIQGLFDLTPAEARVARGVAEGRTPQDLASGAGLSPATVRTQLKAVFAKTGASRQAELVRLLSGLSI